MLLEITLGLLVIYLLKRYFSNVAHNSDLARRGIKPFSSIPGKRGIPGLGTFYEFIPGGKYALK